ncbi:MAG: Transcriptional regulator [Labilithrix sp.]|nr:Transcriptional regulator [Labilithrix sp.]
MDLESVRMFVRVAEQASFTRAAEQLGLPKSRVSLRIKDLENELGSALLHRTTRAVRLTPDGEQFLGRARAFVEEADELATMFQATSTLRGLVRIDLPIAFARNLIIPRLPELLGQHPHLQLIVSTTDRRVDVVRDGFDCVLRIGSLVESGLVARRLGVLAMVNGVSASYARRHGVPRTLADLDRHLLVSYSLVPGGEEPSFEYREGTRWVSRPMKSVVTVNNTDAYQSACLAGLGIIQAPRYGMADALRRGELVEVLPDHPCEPMPVSLVHAHGKNVPKRVRAVMAFLAQALEPAFVVP